jgi:hypothetical protein
MNHKSVLAGRLLSLGKAFDNYKRWVKGLADVSDTGMVLPSSIRTRCRALWVEAQGCVDDIVVLTGYLDCTLGVVQVLV